MQIESGIGNTLYHPMAAIGHIERALGFKLYDNQINYISGGVTSPMYDSDRGTGKTTAYCIRLALTYGSPLDLKYPEKFSDAQYLEFTCDHARRYSRDFFLHEFMTIREKLSKYGFPVRQVIDQKSKIRRA